MNKKTFLDMDLCVGCGACAVACMDQNDIFPEQGQPALGRIYRIERGEFPNASILHASASCMHCQDSPCVMGCPTGAVTKDEKTGAVTVNQEFCIGCHSSALACPFGVPRCDQNGKIQKCDLCKDRVEAGLEPACVRSCPTDALTFDCVNNAQSAKEVKVLGHLLNIVSLA